MVIIENNSRGSKYKDLKNAQGLDVHDSLLTTAVEGTTPEMTNSPHMKKIHTNATKIQNQQNSFINSFSP